MTWPPFRPRLLMVATAIVGIAGGCFFAFHSREPAGAFHERQLTLTGHPLFQSDPCSNQSSVLVAIVDSDSQKRKFPWPQQALAAGELPPAKNLRFTFFESPHGASWPLELSRIDDDSRTLFDGSICLLHRESMHRTLVRMLQPSELIYPAPAIEDALFPHSGFVVARPGMGSFEIPTWICETCRRERDRWLDKARQTASASN